MDILFEFSQTLLNQINDSFFRNLIYKINWSQRMLAIKGPRGTGKTTLMLQYMKFFLKRPAESLYISADHYWFYTHNLVETADTFYKNGGRFLFIDEIHKYPGWSRELKNIYDGYPNLKVVFSSSSVLNIYRGEADLSRRVLTYELPGLSFREFLLMKGAADAIEPLSIPELQANSIESALRIIEKIGHPLPLFREYMRSGYFPFAFENNAQEELAIRLNQVVNTVIETDLPAAESYDARLTFKLKRLLGVIAESVPFKPNVSALARKLDVSRETIYAWFSLLESTRLLNLLAAQGKGVSLLQKPDKVYLENTNLAYALSLNPDIGNLRETFLLNQLKNGGLKVSLPKSGDFFIQDESLYIETGGKNKNEKQVSDYENYLIAADDIETGFGKKVPLWLFGFLY